MDSGDEDIGRDFAKISRQTFNAGYRDGISEGKEVVFQKGFDCGYSHGFQIGLTAGFYKGFSDSVKNHLDGSCSSQIDDLTTFSTTDSWLNDASRKSCVVCEDSNLLKAACKLVEEKQLIKNKEIVDNLTKKYSPLLNEFSIENCELKKIINI